MERLDLSQKPAYVLEESAIHCARYANILHLVKDKIVLDIACGEGYGAALLKKAGAKRVVAVDISAESIETAKKLFGEFGVEYIAGDANTVSEICGESLFDIVVSIETIEHIKTPDIYLESIKKSAKSDAVFYITCPNDYWYYPQEQDSNPYHIRKYTLEDFQELTLPHLGNNVQWGLGAAVFGFGTIPLERETFIKLGNSWMEVNIAESTVNVLNDTNKKTAKENCSYFVGLWNAPSTNFSSSVFSLNMDVYNRLVEEMESNVIHSLRDYNDSLCEYNDSLSKELRHANLRLMAGDAEVYALKQSLAREKSQVLMMQVPYYRYMRIASIVPSPMKRAIYKLYKFLKK